MRLKEHASGWFMIVLLVTGLGMSVITMINIQKQAEPIKTETLLKGKWAALYEDHYNKNLHSFDISKNIWGVVNYAAFGEGMEGVVISENGWLFTAEEFELHQNEQQNFENNIAYIKNVAAYLDSRDIELVVVPVPAKARVYKGNYLEPYEFPSYKARTYHDFLNAMKAADIDAVDTLQAMNEYRQSNREYEDKLYLKTDTHWSPNGANVTADSIARYIKKARLDVIDEKQFYRSYKTHEEKFNGDLTRYVPVQMFASFVPMPSEKLTLYETVSAQAGKQEKQDMAAALFDQDVPPVTLVGTSYSANDQWNFEGFLKEHLASDVLNAAEEGMGPFETMNKYLSDGAFESTPPKMVLWEIPERYLSFNYDLTAESKNEDV